MKHRLVARVLLALALAPAALAAQAAPPDTSWFRANYTKSLTGVPEETIIQMAREFSSHQPAIAITGRGVGMQTNGTYAQMAVDCLNALVG